MTADAERNRPLDATIAVAGATLLLTSFGGWTTREGSAQTDTWHGSSLWPGPIVLGLFAAAAWLLSSRRIIRAGSAAVAACAGVWAVAYVAVLGHVRYERSGYLGVGLLGALAVLAVGDVLRRRTSVVQIAVSILSAEIAVLSVLPWWLGYYDGDGAFTLWRASTVWTVTALVILGAAGAVLVLDSRGTRVVAAASSSVAAGWALAYTLPLPSLPVSGDGNAGWVTVAIANFKPPPRPRQFQRDHLVAASGHPYGTTEYAIGGVSVMATLAAVLIVAAVVGLRRRAR